MREFKANIRGFILFGIFYFMTLNFQNFIYLGDLGNWILINLLLYISIVLLLSYSSCTVISSIICTLVIIFSYIYAYLFHFPRNIWFFDGFIVFLVFTQITSSMRIRRNNRFNTNFQKIYYESSELLDVSFFDYMANEIITSSNDSIEYLNDRGYVTSSDQMFTFILFYYLFSVDNQVQERYKIAIFDSLIYVINRYISTQRILDTKRFLNSLDNIRKFVTKDYEISLKKCLHAIIDVNNLGNFEYSDFDEFVHSNLTKLNNSFESLSA